MKSRFTRLLSALAVSVGLVGAVGPLPAAAAQNQTVTLTDSGFSPASVSVGPSGTVTWVNNGSNVHTASSTGGAPLPFDTGGLAPGQSASFSFSLEGTYPYSSAVDCLNGNSSPSFRCGTFTVIVSTSAAGAASSPVTAPPSAPAVAPSPFGASGSSSASATVAMSDATFTPTTVNLALGGTVTWVNQGSGVHTATSTSTASSFDSGGLGPGQSSAVLFNAPGSFTYSSYTDCLGNNNPGFRCGTIYTINVSDAAGVVPIPAVLPASVPVAVPQTANNTVNFVGGSGFTPNTLNIRVGQTVTWVNQDSQVHTITSNSGYVPSFDSGGLDKNQKYSYQFTTTGTFGYHSATEPNYYIDTNICQCTLTSFLYTGTIVVTA